MRVSGGFFAFARKSRAMSTVRDALRSLPRGVFADFLESDDAYLFVIDVPGASAETTDVRVTESTIRIEARRDKDVPDGFVFAREDRPVFLDVTIPLPLEARSDGSSASVSHGVLEITIPKTGGGEGRAIAIEDE